MTKKNDKGCDYSLHNVAINGVTPEKWVQLVKLYGDCIFTKASCTFLKQSTPETLRDDVINAFINDLLLNMLADAAVTHSSEGSTRQLKHIKTK